MSDTWTDCEQSLDAAGVSSLSVAAAPLSAPVPGAATAGFTSADTCLLASGPTIGSCHGADARRVVLMLGCYACRTLQQACPCSKDAPSLRLDRL